jgi:dihydroxyacetone kinase-like protein
MKKLINSVEDAMTESLAGFCAAHSDIVRRGELAPFVQRLNL